MKKVKGFSKIQKTTLPRRHKVTKILNQINLFLVTLWLKNIVFRGALKFVSDDLRKEYKRFDFDKLERGRYFKRVIANSNVVVIDPAVTALFPNSVSANKALHSLDRLLFGGLADVAEKAVSIAGRSTARTRRRSIAK